MAGNMLGNMKLGLKEYRHGTNEKADMISYDFWSNSRKNQAIAGTKILLWNSKDVRFRNCTWRGKITNIAEEVSDRIDLLLYIIKIYVYFKYDFRTCTFKKNIPCSYFGNFCFNGTWWTLILKRKKCYSYSTKNPKG